MKRNLLLFILLTAVAYPAAAQTVGQLRLPGDYYGKLDGIVDRMSADMGVRFIFDREYLARFTTSLTTYEEKNINGVLKMLGKTWGMASSINDDGFIYIAKDAASLAALMGQRTEQAATVEVVKQEQRSGLRARGGDPQSAPAPAAADAPQAEQDGYLFVQSEYRTVRIAFASIRYVESMSEYVRIHLREGRPVITLMSLRALAGRLPATRFMRVHRSYIVALDAVQVVERGRIVFDDRTVIPVGEQYREQFQSFIDTHR